jgi:secreted trypsin-like serine protease
MNRLLAIAAASLAALAALPATASAIVGGSADNGAHPSVGLLSVDGQPWCTGTLVTPDRVLTAAHCAPAEGALVTMNFSDDASAGIEYAGHIYANPVFAARNGYARDKIANDVAVVVLDAPVTGITPSRIAPEGLLDGLTTKQLKAAQLTVVGYGLEGFVKGDNGPHTAVGDLTRKQATYTIHALQDGIMRVNANKTGGTCFGDSGGPAFYGSYIVSVTSNGSPWCQSWEERVRVDAGPARSFLAGYGVL